MPTLFRGLLPVLVSTLFHQPAKALPEVDRNRVLIAYNSAYDTCKGVHDSSGITAKLAADKACEQAFEALDKLELNTCHGWRNAECSLAKGDLFRKCSCTISNCDEQSIRNTIYKPLQQCAALLWAEEQAKKVTPSPTIEFQQLRSKYNDAWKNARTQLASSRAQLSASSSGAAFSRREGSSRGAPHFPVHQGETSLPYPCPWCLMRFGLPEELGLHMQEHRLEDRMPSLPGSPVLIDADGRFVCRECGNSYVRLRVLREHEKCHKSKSLTCPYCDQVYTSKAGFKGHMKRRHPEFPAEKVTAHVFNHPEVVEKFYQCIECDKSFKNKRGLNDHMFVHEGLTKCDECGKTFSRIDALGIHKKTQHRRQTD